MIATKFLPFAGRIIKYYPTLKPNPLGISTVEIMYGVNVPLEYAGKTRRALSRRITKHIREGRFPKWTTLRNGQVVNEAHPMFWLRNRFWNGKFKLEKFRREFGVE